MDRRNTLGLPRAVAYELSEDEGRNPSRQPTIGDVVNQRFGRRDMLRGALAASAITAIAGPAILDGRPASAAGTSRFVFDEVPHGVDATHHVAPGYDADILIRWGDPVVKGAPAFDPHNQTADAQEKQFGYNNDYIAVIPLEGAADRALLCVNHEYTSEELMFPGLSGPQDSKDAQFKDMTPERIEIEMAAHGASVLEIERTGGKWRVVADSKYNRRISTRSTEVAITGPAAGDARMKTKADPSGTKMIGMVNNCAGGVTPWGTYLSGEENFHGYFWGKMPEEHREAANHKRYGVPGNWYNWGTVHERYDVTKEPNEANRFGWVVEIDPTDPTSTPKKRTALGRFKHEGVEPVLLDDGRVVFYMGDDERFEYVYKFVTAGKFNPNDRAANADLLDEGTLYVARFNADGAVTWLPLVHGQNGLTAENGFASQADVLIETRRAADVVKATPMDRPEDVEPNRVTGKVYVMLTNNTRRKPDQLDGPNPRADNKFGQIVEITPAAAGHGAETATWDILVQCGDPSVAEVGAKWNAATSPNGWFGMPDMCAVDADGRLWIGTDGMNAKSTGTADGLFGLESEGEGRGTSKQFFRCPAGAEMCGPVFTPDQTALFLAIQHPGEDGETWPEFGRASTFADPATRWPDFKGGMPPRPSVVVVTKQGGGKIAS
ncbi:PhoX family phosphatase [Inquilinus sp. Marseille-Q2685]|uniref:PhoX family protein n=1 Tax=Inquilinus sp. Marseille-Q2685 TaxID=2866581 RepID=UPI001CE41AB6|nr:PhoX family phosphatase [Inquilinus sp. Marseille-Q2685]